jgi:hypothetical protein
MTGRYNSRMGRSMLALKKEKKIKYNRRMSKEDRRK